MSTFNKTVGVNSARKRPTLCEGMQLISQLPAIRESFRYRLNRWQQKRKGEWNFCTRAWLVRCLSSVTGDFGLSSRRVQSVLMVLKRDGENAVTEEVNSFLLANPEIAAQVRSLWMPHVRRFFKFMRNRLFEAESRRWKLMPWDFASCSVQERLQMAVGEMPSEEVVEACTEELQWEGKR